MNEKQNAEQSQEAQVAGSELKATVRRCEGWRRYGGAFSLGGARWEQCKNNAAVILDIEQEKREKMPACLECWEEGKSAGIKIHSADLIDA